MRQFVTTCISCVKTKGGRVVPRPLLHVVRATAPNQALHFDYMFVHEPTERTPGGARYLLLVIDCFSHYTELVAVPSASSDTVEIMLLQWFYRFGVVSH